MGERYVNPMQNSFAFRPRSTSTSLISMASYSPDQEKMLETVHEEDEVEQTLTTTKITRLTPVDATELVAPFLSYAMGLA